MKTNANQIKMKSFDITMLLILFLIFFVCISCGDDGVFDGEFVENVELKDKLQGTWTTCQTCSPPINRDTLPSTSLVEIHQNPYLIPGPGQKLLQNLCCWLSSYKLFCG